MMEFEILDRDFNRLCFISNDAGRGLHYFGDALTTSINGGVYTLDISIPKRVLDQGHADKIRHVKEGNYLRFRNVQNVPILMTILQIIENSNHKQVYAEDTSLALNNTTVHSMDTPAGTQNIAYYLSETLSSTGFKIGLNESTEKKILDFSSHQNALERIREIVKAFEVEFYFSVEFNNPLEPEFKLNIVKRRLEGEEGFTISSDDLLSGVERDINTDNVVTKVYVYGKAIEAEPVEVVAPTPSEPIENTNVEKVITEAMRVRDMKLPYRWGGNGLSGMDCSGFVSHCFRTANYPGYPTTGRPTTNSMWTGSHSSYFNRVSRANVQRGDILLWDTGYTYPGDANHTGIALDNKQAIHSGNPNGIIQNIDSMKFIGAIRVK